VHPSLEVTALETEYHAKGNAEALLAIKDKCDLKIRL